MKKYLGLTVLLFCSLNLFSATTWSLYLNFPVQKRVLVENFELNKAKDFSGTKCINRCIVSYQIKRENGYWAYVVDVKTDKSSANCFLSLSKQYNGNIRPYCFSTEVSKSVVFRQSPHEPADHEMTGLRRQPVPMVALFNGKSFEIAICNSPVYFDNYCTQTFDLKNRIVSLSSGDLGGIYENEKLVFVDSLKRKETKKYSIEPHFFAIDKALSHHMDGIIADFQGSDPGQMRMQVNEIISKHWSKNKIADLLGASVFSTAYMNLRVNETGKSKYWVIPAIEYANKQYSRDAFWISMVLPDQFSLSSYENEASNDTRFTGAERQLFTLVWAYRNYAKGLAVDTIKVRRMLTIVEKHAPNGYYSGFGPSRKLGCWQGWADDLAFDEEDAITNNQGLYVVALMCAQRMGVQPSVSIEQALDNYRNSYNQAIGGYSISHLKRDVLCVDALMGDLLAQVYLGVKLLPAEQVITHYETMKRVAKTSVGFKCFCNSDGTFLSSEQYNSKKYTAAVDKIENGTYQFGGSWYLYDMQMLMDAYLAGAKDAEELMIWRTKLEFEKGNTTHEYINTTTGQPYKPNMGWNAGVYGLWSELVKQGKVKNRIFLKEVK